MRTWRIMLAFASALLAAACAPFSRDIPYATLESLYGNGASQYLELSGGVRIHYRVHGPQDAPALVLVHGFAASLHSWEPWVERLQGRYRIISVDLPGHGLTRTPTGYVFSASSNAELIDELMHQLRIQRFSLAGHSMGGAVAVRYALRHPERLDALVLVGAAAWPSGERAGRSPLVFQLLRNPVGRAVLRYVNPRLFAQRGLASAYHDPALADEALVDRYVDLARAPGRRAMLTSGRNNSADAPLRPEDLAAIAAPTLVMHGEHDRIIAIDAGRALAAAIPGAQLIAYAEAGHLPHEELPDQTARDLDAFLQDRAR